MHDHGPSGAAHRLGHGLDIERHERAQIDDLGAHPLLLKRRRCGQGVVHAAPVADEGDVGARPLDIGATERNRESGIDWDRALLALQADRLDEQAGILVEDRGGQQAFAVTGGRRDDDFHPGDVHEPGLECLRVRRTGAESGVHLGADGDGRGRSACGHEAELGGVVDDLVRGDADEVHDHDLGHRKQAVDRRTDRGTDDRGLRDRGVQHPVVAVLGRQPRGRAGRAGVGDVLTEQEHPFVGFQRLVEREVQRLAHRHHLLVHVGFPQTG